MEQAIRYKRKEIETESLERKVLVHRAMHYECENCGSIYRIWLEKGLEDKKQDKINLKNHKPVPFCIGCLCGGIARHVGIDINLDDYRLLEDNENYFENREDQNCGIVHFRKEGELTEMQREYQSAMEQLAIWVKDNERELEELAKERQAKEDDPYGLAEFSTSALKAELRRRKRWK